jgi:cytosine deaminase
MSINDEGFKIAVEQAKKSLREGGIPIGACLVSADGKIIGRGHNERVQRSSAILHVCSAAIGSEILWPY